MTLRANDLAPERARHETTFLVGGRLAGEAIHLALNELPVEPFTAHQQVGRA